MWAAKCGLILDADPRTSTSTSMANWQYYVLDFFI
jgi:hypothetical protein